MPQPPTANGLTTQNNPARGFSLVELLVVIGIIAVLVAILLPVMGKVRASAQRAACMSNLREIGNMFQMYLNENKQRVPRVNPIRSMSLLPYPAPTIYEVLDRYTKGDPRILKCPSDKMVNRLAGSTGNFETYYEQEGGSYEYNVWFNAFAYDEQTGINKVWRDALDDAAKNAGGADKVVLFRDFDPFHDKPGKPTSRNHLYADFSVDELRPRTFHIRPPGA